MASTAALQFGQLLYTSLVQSGAISPAVPAIVSPLSVWFALVLLLNGAGEQLLHAWALQAVFIAGSMHNHFLGVAAP